ncbi:hypothetical protein [Bacillus gaemokensis]|uniref:Uncharacterized protein n=1 Tax=Bacillus gaemokensis TaxID=574375 RepID=A0A073KIH9_9BACI|nr:hypothetical protein [Bacillus gaemokensis]KEK22143.1 hypothetical protein BAGA_20925 [Bacillus gaemokensis]KYG35580.1 hypothetical protein AZF08_26250 [Bacillus gaemokensis]
MKEIDKYLFLSEASYIWGIPYNTVRNKVKPSVTSQEEIDRMIQQGLIKYFEPPQKADNKSKKTQKSWIVSRAAMYEWFGNPRTIQHKN